MFSSPPFFQDYFSFKEEGTAPVADKSTFILCESLLIDTLEPSHLESMCS